MRLCLKRESLDSESGTQSSLDKSDHNTWTQLSQHVDSIEDSIEGESSHCTRLIVSCSRLISSGEHTLPPPLKTPVRMIRPAL